ncbi:MAG: GIY-YIG nuclease family protein [Bacteroidota bacterium]
MAQHKARVNPKSFSARYFVNRLVYFEVFQSINEAIAREKEIKGWKRIRKIALIEARNPTWKDLSLEWDN